MAHAEAYKDPGTPEEQSRRTFMANAVIALGGVIGISLAIPLVGSLLPAAGTSNDAWSALTGYSSNFDVFNGSPAALNEWAYLVETFDGTTVKLYVNGALATSGTASGYTANTGAPLLIGSSDYGSGPTAPTKKVHCSRRDVGERVIDMGK